MAVLDMSRPLVVHAHSQAHILFKIGGIDSQFQIRDRMVPITDRDAVLISSWEPHAYCHPDDQRRMLVLAIYIEPLWLAATSPGWQPRPRFAANSMPIDPAMQQVVHELAKSLISNDELQFDTVERAVLAIVNEAHQRVAARAGEDDLNIDRRVARCVSYMKDHLYEREDLEQVGRRFGMSRPHMFYMFQRTFQLTPNVYWNTLRMEHAVEQLRAGRRSIGAIARDIGFGSQANFTRFFVGIQGVAPREYQSAVSELHSLRAA